MSRVAAEIKASETTASASSEAPTAEASQSSSAAERLFSDLVPLDGEEGLGGGARRRPPERTKSASSSRKQRGSRMGLNLVRGINIPFIILSSLLVQTKSVEQFWKEPVVFAEFYGSFCQNYVCLFFSCLRIGLTERHPFLLAIRPVTCSATPTTRTRLAFPAASRYTHQSPNPLAQERGSGRDASRYRDWTPRSPWPWSGSGRGSTRSGSGSPGTSSCWEWE